MVAIMASILCVRTAHAASDAAPEQLLKSTAGHCKFERLTQDFRSGPEVSKACLADAEAARQKLNASNRRNST